MELARVLVRLDHVRQLFPTGSTVFEAQGVEKSLPFPELALAVSVERGRKRKPRATMKAENLAIAPIRGSSLSSLADNPHSIEFNLFQTLDGLINGWCERRALRPLGYLLPAYPGVLTHTREQFQLLEALKNLKRLCRDYLTPEELRLVTQAHNSLEERLRTRVI